MSNRELTHVDLAAFDQLSSEQLALWSQWQLADANLESPFFRPEFVRLVDRLRDDVEVGILRAGEETIGFFPFHRNRHNIGVPVGAWFSDYHGIVAAPDALWSPLVLLRDCGLTAWHFDHLIRAQTPFQPYLWPWIEASSPYLDLSQGFEAYYRTRKKARGDELSKTLQKSRKLQREIGDVRFVDHVVDADVLRQMIAWKSEQYQALNVRNYLGPDWAAGLLQQLMTARGEHFSGMLSALYAGERLAAVNLCVRSHGVLHMLVMAYNCRLARYSPGIILLVKLAQHCEALGVRRLDLGRGNEEYKSRLMSGAVPLAEGAVDSRILSNFVRRGVSRTRELVRSSPLGRPTQQFVRAARHWWSPNTDAALD